MKKTKRILLLVCVFSLLTFAIIFVNLSEIVAKLLTISIVNVFLFFFFVTYATIKEEKTIMIKK